jgi:hypothetical protein
VDRSTDEGMVLGILDISKHFCHDIQIDYGVEASNRVASELVTLLRRSMFLYDDSTGDDVHTKEFRSSGLEYIASLSTSLTMVLHCSSTVLPNKVKEFQNDLVPTLTRMAEKFGSSDDNAEEDTILLQVIIANASRIIHLIGPHLQEHTDDFVDALLQMLIGGGSRKSAVVASVCDTLFNLMQSHGGLLSRNKIIPKLEGHANVLLCLLSMAESYHSSGNGRVNLTTRLYDLAELSYSIRMEMMNRRCVVVTIVKHFLHPKLDIRLKAFVFCQELVNHPEISSSNRFSNGIYENLVVIESGLIEHSFQEKDPTAQGLVASLIHNLIALQTFPSYRLMEVARSLAYSDQDDDVIIPCGVAYCEGMQKEPFPSVENLSTVVDFTTFPFAQIRGIALQTVERILATKSEESVGIALLLEETELIENLTMIVAHGSDIDCNVALKIVREVSRSNEHYSQLCRNTVFLSTLVNFVSHDSTVLNCKSHFLGIEIILALLSHDDTTESFLPYQHLLPWLVRFLNQTTAEESFKQIVVKAVIHLSTAYLNHNNNND